MDAAGVSMQSAAVSHANTTKVRGMVRVVAVRMVWTITIPMMTTTVNQVDAYAVDAVEAARQTTSNVGDQRGIQVNLDPTPV